MKVLSAYVRNEMRAGDVAGGAELPDIRDPRRERAEEVLRVIGPRSPRGRKVEARCGYQVDLCHVDARAMQLPGCDFSRIEARGTHFSQARLDGAVFRGSQLVGARFNGAGLRSTDLSHVDLQFAYMAGADLTCGSLAGSQLRWTDMPESLYLCDLSDARLFEVRGLKQETLDGADGRIHTPPSIVACLVPDTGEELRWAGGDGGGVPEIAAAFGSKRATSPVIRALARLLPVRPAMEEVIASERIAEGLRFLCPTRRATRPRRHVRRLPVGAGCELVHAHQDARGGSQGFRHGGVRRSGGEGAGEAFARRRAVRAGRPGRLRRGLGKPRWDACGIVCALPGNRASSQPLAKRAGSARAWWPARHHVQLQAIGAVRFMRRAHVRAGRGATGFGWAWGLRS